MSDVIVLKTKEDQIERNIYKIFELAGGIDKYINKGDNVLIKPNFIVPKKSSSGATTDLRIIEAVIKAILKQKAMPIIGEGVPYSFNADETFKRVGIDKIAKKHNIQLINMDNYIPKNVKIKNSLAVNEILISNLVFEVDKIINLPVMKTHTQTTVTLGMKNLKGCIIGKEKLILHHVGLSEGIVDLNTILKPTFTIIDGIVGMEGNGPTNGKPKRMNLLLGSSDILALEIIGSKIMGFNPYSIKHIYLAKDKKIGEYDIKHINVIGENIEEVKDKFSLPILKINKWFGPFFLGHLLPFLSKCGIDISKISQKLFNYFMPYPTFIGNCKGCARCVTNCPQKAISFKGKLNPVINKKRCIKCYVCDEVCLHKNIRIKRRG